MWRTLCPSIDVLVDTAAIGTDSMDAEALHRFRVALRRLRCDLRSLRPFLSKPLVTSLRERLSELDELVRPVRDGDVMVERLTATAAKVHNRIDPDIVEALHHNLVAAAATARYTLVSEISSGRFDALFGELAGLRDSEFMRVDLTAEFPVCLERVNKELWKRVKRTARVLTDDADDDALHALRVLIKRSRYLAEASVPELGRSAKRRASAAAQAQLVLGEHQDSVVFSHTLVAMQQPTPAHMLAINALLAVESDARRKLRKRWRKVWRRMDRQRM